MKILLAAFFLVFSTGLYAQSNPPQAGKYGEGIGLYHQTLNSVPFSEKYSEILDFDSSNVSFTGNFPFAESYALTLAETENLVFVGSGGGIYPTDISDPEHPLILSEIRTRSLVDACSYDPVKKRLYVCAYFSGIEIWDLSNIHTPIRMSRIPTERYPRSGVHFIGDYIIAATNNSVYSFDISDPYHPVQAGELYISQNLIMQTYLKDTVLYLVSNIQGVRTINVTDPENMQQIYFTAYAKGSRFDISGNYLYAVNGSGDFTILDITNPAGIQFVSSLGLGDYPQDIRVFGNKAYVAKGGTGGGLEIINVENPASPVTITTYAGDFGWIEGAQNYVYISRYSDFTILDVTNPNQIVLKGSFKIPGFVDDVSVKGNYLYTGSNGFRVIELTDPSVPTEIGYAPINGLLTAPAENDIVVFSPNSMTANNTIHIMDVSVPQNPVSLDSYTCPAMTVDIKVKDTLLFTACWWDGIRIFTFNDPQNIIHLSHTMGWVQGGIPGEEWFYVQALDVEGNFLYAVDYGPFPNEDTYGLYILDISNPSVPVLVKRFKNITGKPQDIDVQDGIAYLPDGEGGVEIVNCTDPQNPSVIRYIALIDGATGICVSGDFAYVSNYILGGVQVIDITNPAAADVIGWYKPTGVFALNVAHNNGHIFVADGIGGIQIYRNLLEPTSVNNGGIILNNFTLTNYPNPFNPATIIEYSIPGDASVKIRIFNILGEEKELLLNEFIQAGKHKIQFNGSGLASGVYLCTIESGNYLLTRKIILLK